MRRFLKLGFTAIAAIGMSAALTGCGDTIANGNFGLEKTFFTNQYTENVYDNGWHPAIFNHIFEVYGREDTLKIETIHPKDKDSVLYKDLDLIVTFKINPQKAKDFIVRTSDIVVGADKEYHVGLNRVDRDARNIIGETTRKFSSVEVLNDPKKLENEFKKDLQESLDKEYGKDTFNIVNIKASNILVADSIEARIQSIALIDAETAKNNAILAILKNREARMIAEAKAIKNAADASGLTVDQLLQAQMIDAMKDTGLHPQATVDVTHRPKIK